MPFVICKLKNVGKRINGVNFTQTNAGHLSEEVSEEVAAFFASIPGYEIVEGQGKKKSGQKSTTESSQTESDKAADKSVDPASSSEGNSPAA